MAYKQGKHTTSHRYDIQLREFPPKLEPTKTGMRVLCPFCALPHPLVPGEEASCGTVLKVTAVQAVMPAKRAQKDKVKCLKCHKIEGGDMVRYMSGYIHVDDCLPGTRLLVQTPKFSRTAALVHWLGEKSRIRKGIETLTGAAQEVREIDVDGKDTGRVLGHFFLKQPKKV